MKDERKLGFDTLAVHGGYDPGKHGGAMSPPIYQTNAYDFGSVEHAANVFSLREPGDIYSRLTNPTVRIFEERMALLEGGSAAVAFASGHNAIFSVICNLCSAGDNIISSMQIYGGAVNLFAVTLAKLGIEVRFVDCDDYDGWASLADENTKLFFFETVGNPNANIADISRICETAHAKGIPVMADSTFTSPFLVRPFEHGADIVVHSATKYLCGHGNTMGGIVIESGRFGYKNNPRFPSFNQPDPSYHGIVYCDDFADSPFCSRLRTLILRDIGGCMPAMSAYFMLLGLETLSLRMQRHVENAEKIAAFLQSHPKVAKVNYPGLPDSKYHGLAQKYLPSGAGAVFTIELDGDRSKGAKFMDALSIFKNVSNVCDARSMVTHPASTTHSQMTKEQLSAANITEGTVRISVGLEDAADLIRDLETALKEI